MRGDVFRAVPTWRASSISLRYAPASDAAKALTAEVLNLIIPHFPAGRTMGPGKFATRLGDTGVVLAGLLREAVQGRAVSVREARRSVVWRGDPPLKHDRFWRIVRALEAAKLVTLLKGKATVLMLDGDPLLGGLPGRLAATDDLMRLAARHGLTRASRHDDWTISAIARAKPVKVSRADLVQIGPWVEGRPRAALTAGQRAKMEQLRDDVAALNAAVAAMEIGGAERPVFRRRFNHDLRLGGRLHAGDSYQNMKRAKRPDMTINGAPTAEVDIRASNLSIFNILTGHSIKGDPYALPTLPDAPREAVKAWFRQSFGSGRPAGRWSPKMTLEDHCGIKARAIREAAQAAYPALRDMMAIVPAEVMTTLRMIGIAQRQLDGILSFSRVRLSLRPFATWRLMACSRCQCMTDLLSVPTTRERRVALSWRPLSACWANRWR